MKEKIITHKSTGVDLIELEDIYIPGTVEVEGYTVTEIGGTSLIVLDPIPPIDEELKVKYQIEVTTIKPKEETKKFLERKIVEDLIKTVAIQQETIEQLQKLIKERVTYRHLDAVTKSLNSQLSLIKEHLGAE